MNLSGRLLVIVLLIGPLAGPAWGQAVTWAELQGARVEATIIYDRMIERGGQTFPSRLEQHHSIVVGQGNTFQYTNTAMATGPHGTSTAQPFGGTVTLGKAGAVTNLGGGHHVWFFERGRLTLLRTYRAGGYKIEIAFTRREDELNCTVRAPFVREIGASSIELESIMGAGRANIKILSSKQISSSCKVASR